MSIIGMESCAIKHLFQSAVLAQWMNVVNIKHVILRLKLKRFRLNFASTSIKHECCKYRKVCTDEGSELLEKLYSTLLQTLLFSLRICCKSIVERLKLSVCVFISILRWWLLSFIFLKTLGERSLKRPLKNTRVKCLMRQLKKIFEL